ncbi:hypothetical protein [Novipirellula sp.]|uniref:hypothetical protein n=1 Tax=Novipirellula sp. TaxID=2795430 RepID=UPI003568FE4B
MDADQVGRSQDGVAPLNRRASVANPLPQGIGEVKHRGAVRNEQAAMRSEVR